MTRSRKRLRRLIAAGGLPDRAGQPTQIQLVMTLDQLTGLAGSGLADGTAADGSGWAGPGPLAAPGDDCDASIAPIVTGHVDHDLLARLAATLARPQLQCPGQPFCTSSTPASRTPASRTPASSTPAARPGDTRPDGPCCDDHGDRDEHAERMALLGENAYRELILRQAIALLSGPSGLAARLRTGRLTGPAASISLPLDTGAATDTIPPRLRRAVIARDRHCAWPGGCSQRPAACEVHHLVPRSKGGRTVLTNCGLFCSFHHLIVIHRWGWNMVLNADGT